MALLIALVGLGAFAGRAIQDELTPCLSFPAMSTAYGVGPPAIAAEASATARVSRDLPVLEEFWGVGGGPVVGVQYVEFPGEIRAGRPLHVKVHGYELDGRPLAGANVEVSWRLGAARYSDVTQTDSRGDVDVTRRINSESRGTECYVAVRMTQGDRQGMAYTSFTPR